MNSKAKLGLILSAFLLSSSVTAGLYKGLDADGNVTYSDKPFADAEKITPPAITVVDAPKVKPKEKASVEDKDKEPETKYSYFSITSPNDEETIWNESQLSVSLDIQPPLNTTQGHNVWLIMDGKPLVKYHKSPLVQIGRADRGSHVIRAQIRNKKGKVLSETRSVTVFIKNTVVPRKARAN